MTSESPQSRELTRIVLRPLATPLPLGVLAFGSVLLTALQLKWLAPAESHEVAGVVLVLVVPLELLATVVAFAIRSRRWRPHRPSPPRRSCSVSRRSTSATAMSGDLGEQLDSLPTEDGIRRES